MLNVGVVGDDDSDEEYSSELNWVLVVVGERDGMPVSTWWIEENFPTLRMGGRFMGKRIRHARSEGCGGNECFEDRVRVESTEDRVVLKLSCEDASESVELRLALWFPYNALRSDTNHRSNYLDNSQMYKVMNMLKRHKSY